MSVNDGNFVDWRENEEWSDDDANDYDDNYLGYEEDDAGNVVKVGQERRNRQSSNEHSRVDLAAKYRDRVNVEKYDPSSAKEKVRRKDKADRATVEQVMDHRTRLIVFQWLDRDVISEFNGCISTGKEANVYHCKMDDNENGAVKIYKTSILVFKDRDKYVTGEFRFRKGYGKNNPRKMVRTWAEKEMRNLIRLHKAGILCPKPILLRSHVLLMSFIGSEDGWPAPRLRDVELGSSKARELYWDLCLTVRKIYHSCKLVHGDLSEFNLLYHEGKAYVIDVSQSVEHDHPRALDFLRKDLQNVTEFFRRKGVNVLGVRQLFDFVVDPSIEAGQAEEVALQELNQRAEEAMTAEEERSAEQIVEEEIFKNIHIPRTLDEVSRPEIETARVKTREESQPYQAVAGIAKIIINEEDGESAEEKGSVSDGCGSDDSDESSDSGNEDGEVKGGCMAGRRPRDESPNSRKERKKAFREEKSAKRKEKVKKHVKKRKEKVAKTKK